MSPKAAGARIGLRDIRRGGVFIGLVLLICVSGILAPKTVDPAYFIEVMRITSILGIVSIAQTLLILTRGIDLSVGVHMTLIMVLVDGLSLGRPENTALVIVVAFAAGLLISLINGLLVVKLKLEPLVGSLGVMTLITGANFIYTKGFAGGVAPPFIHFLGSGRLLGFLPVPVLIWLIAALGVSFLLRNTVFGRYVFACGANPRAARLAGIRVDLVRMTVYVIGGFLTAAAGIIWAGFLGTPTLAGGAYYPLDSIAAVVIGGTTFAGGKGGVGGTVAGAIIVVYLSSVLTIIGLGEPGKLVVQGVVILLLVLVYTGRKKAR
jgi:ribose transport system permease protein